MSIHSLFGRFAALVVMLGLPAGALGYSVAGFRGGCAFEVLAGALLVAAFFWAEPGFLKAYRANSQSNPGAELSLQRVLNQVGGEAPRLLSFNDLAPQALVVRSPGGAGTILLSEGLLGALSEDELRALLTVCLERLRRRGICFQSLCAWLAHLCFGLAPGPWTAMLMGRIKWDRNLGVVGALRFLPVYAVAHLLLGLGRGAVVDAPLPRLPEVLGEVVNPGSCILHVGDPWAMHSLFPL